MVTMPLVYVFISSIQYCFYFPDERVKVRWIKHRSPRLSRYPDPGLPIPINVNSPSSAAKTLSQGIS